MKRVEYLNLEKIGRSGIPVLHVVIKNDDNEVEKEGWLSPFRGYSFQVSGTPDGHGDHGASKVIGLKHCIYFQNGTGAGYQSNLDFKGIGKQLLLGQALIAMLKWTRSEVDLGDWQAQFFNETNQMSSFIDECYEWLCFSI